MAAHLTIVSESSVDQIRDEGEFDTFLKDNSAAQVSRGLLSCARSGSQLMLITDSKDPKLLFRYYIHFLVCLRRETY